MTIAAGIILGFSGINTSATAQEVGDRMPPEFDEKYIEYSRVWFGPEINKVGLVKFYKIPKEGGDYEGRILYLACEKRYIPFSIYDGRKNKEFIDNKRMDNGKIVKESDRVIDGVREHFISYPYEDIPNCPGTNI